MESDSWRVVLITATTIYCKDSRGSAQQVLSTRSGSVRVAGAARNVLDEEEEEEEALTMCPVVLGPFT